MKILFLILIVFLILFAGTNLSYSQDLKDGILFLADRYEFRFGILGSFGFWVSDWRDGLNFDIYSIFLSFRPLKFIKVMPEINYFPKPVSPTNISNLISSISNKFEIRFKQLFLDLIHIDRDYRISFKVGIIPNLWVQYVEDFTGLRHVFRTPSEEMGLNKDSGLGMSLSLYLPEYSSENVDFGFSVAVYDGDNVDRSENFLGKTKDIELKVDIPIENLVFSLNSYNTILLGNYTNLDITETYRAMVRLISYLSDGSYAEFVLEYGNNFYSRSFTTKWEIENIMGFLILVSSRNEGLMLYNGFYRFSPGFSGLLDFGLPSYYQFLLGLGLNVVLGEEIFGKNKGYVLSILGSMKGTFFGDYSEFGFTLDFKLGLF